MTLIPHFVLGVSFLFASSTACRCLQQDLLGSLETNDYVGQFVPLFAIPAFNHIYWFTFRKQSLKESGCGGHIRLPRLAWMKTAESGDSCGFRELSLWRSFLLFGNVRHERLFPWGERGTPVLTIDSCQYQKQWNQVDEKDRAFLNTEIPRLAASACPVASSCSSDADCEKREQYCAGGTCATHGTCRNVRDCYNPANNYLILKKCMYYIDCDDGSGTCEGVCRGRCAGGATIFNCLQSPCDATECNEEYASCQDDYCGGCNALFFNPEGDAVCEGQ